ncbi:hypothetical protein B0T26DRAFT_150796 [Lasiosphaeria miniovina]|uniref:Uncharacterized protein n=1 Tax=Lasiosphaeria miniovina TaxID=1954250 RepID=A0AA40B5W7_9PEZI|nr:uncharacterized protein B0T26DRAFT_150796 [Lasiosphaeria miniovina]KAK0727943.1 hypothetical protein B0T26DRAFT_150796 [Lasiosphaeria miniovina]
MWSGSDMAVTVASSPFFALISFFFPACRGWVLFIDVGPTHSPAGPDTVVGAGVCRPAF